MRRPASATRDGQVPESRTFGPADRLPAAEINPAVMEARSQVGVDLSRGVPEAIGGRIRSGGRSRCDDGLWGRLPRVPREALMDWDVAAIRSMRSGGFAEEVQSRVQLLLTELGTPSTPLAPLRPVGA
jgi:hypothetical protein